MRFPLTTYHKPRHSPPPLPQFPLSTNSSILSKFGLPDSSSGLLVEASRSSLDTQSTSVLGTYWYATWTRQPSAGATSKVVFILSPIQRQILPLVVDHILLQLIPLSSRRRGSQHHHHDDTQPPAISSAHLACAFSLNLTQAPNPASSETDILSSASFRRAGDQVAVPTPSSTPRK